METGPVVRYIEAYSGIDEMDAHRRLLALTGPELVARLNNVYDWFVERGIRPVVVRVRSERYSETAIVRAMRGKAMMLEEAVELVRERLAAPDFKRRMSAGVRFFMDHMNGNREVLAIPVGVHYEQSLTEETVFPGYRSGGSPGFKGEVFVSVPGKWHRFLVGELWLLETYIRRHA